MYQNKFLLDSLKNLEWSVQYRIRQLEEKGIELGYNANSLNVTIEEATEAKESEIGSEEPNKLETEDNDDQESTDDRMDIVESNERVQSYDPEKLREALYNRDSTIELLKLELEAWRSGRYRIHEDPEEIKKDEGAPESEIEQKSGGNPEKKNPKDQLLLCFAQFIILLQAIFIILTYDPSISFSENVFYVPSTPAFRPTYIIPGGNCPLINLTDCYQKP
uniref:Jag_N domain-containing protein n=1 Tax=Caenorhabditis tropicalis TaxID=1561998 RepID=A0A1I7TPN0_9PELO